VSTLNVNTVEPAGATLTIGESGDTVKANDSVNVNTVKDAGGNTIWVSDGSGNLSSVDSAFGDALKLLSTQTASGDASIEFTSGIDSTYKEYIFKFVNINPDTDGTPLEFQCSTDGGSSYGVTQTSTVFVARNTAESGGSADLAYQTGSDEAESTDYQYISQAVGSGSDECVSGELHLFNPASTTYVKNYYEVAQGFHNSPGSKQNFTAGYFNTTSAIDAISFRFNSGNINAGTFKMYGVK